MHVLDANILLYAYDADSAHHRRVFAALDELLASGEMVFLPWLAVVAFVRVASSPGLLRRPLSLSEAFAILEDLFDEPNIRVLDPGPTHLREFRAAAEDGQVTGPLVTDAHLAALAIENGIQFWSADKDFSRFSRLRWKNPLGSK